MRRRGRVSMIAMAGVVVLRAGGVPDPDLEARVGTPIPLVVLAVSVAGAGCSLEDPLTNTRRRAYEDVWVASRDLTAWGSGSVSSPMR
jgi:hypothetical protein